ncbi:hypothetical protein [Nocardioides sp.]
MSLHVITAAAEEAGDAGLNHWVVGGIALAILLALLLGLLAFGAGREHS